MKQWTPLSCSSGVPSAGGSLWIPAARAHLGIFLKRCWRYLETSGSGLTAASSPDDFLYFSYMRGAAVHRLTGRVLVLAN